MSCCATGWAAKTAATSPASRAVEIIGQALSRGLAAHPLPASVKPLLLSAVTAANAVIYDMGAADEGLRGMGTTVVAAVLLGDMLYIAHAGDSRAYLAAEGGPLRRITRDHSVVQLLIESGEITEREARSHPKRNYITRALGVERTVEVEYMEQPLPVGEAAAVYRRAL